MLCYLYMYSGHLRLMARINALKERRGEIDRGIIHDTSVLLLVCARIVAYD